MATTESRFLVGQRPAGTQLVLKVVAACIAAISLPAVMAQQQPVQLAAPQLPPEPQASQAWRLEADVTTTVTATNNSGYTDVQQSRGDVIVNVEPRLRFNSRGGRVSVQGEVGANALSYLRDTQPNRVLPLAQLGMQSTLVERWLYVDGSAMVDQTSSNPYSARPDGASSFNQVTTRRLRVSPYVDHWFTPSLSLLARSDHAWTKRNGRYAAADPRRDAYEQQHLVRVEQQPLPLGAMAEFTRQDTRYDGDADSVLTIDVARGIVNYAVDPQLVVGVIAGRERSEFSLTENTDTLYGARVRWLPTERTDLTAAVERRFFGTGWNAQFTHRTPYLAVHLRSYREPAAQPASQVLAPGGGSVAELLDAILTTRYPDPVAREEMVRNIVQDLNLPDNLSSPIEVFADYAQLQQGTSLSVALLGRRTTVALALHSRRYRQLSRSDDPFTPEPGFTSDNQQFGVTVDITRRLTPQTSVTLWLSGSRIEGLGARDGDYTREKVARLSLQHALSPDTAVTLGARRQLLDSNVSAPARESAAFVAVNYRF